MTSSALALWAQSASNDDDNSDTDLASPDICQMSPPLAMPQLALEDVEMGEAQPSNVSLVQNQMKYTTVFIRPVADEEDRACIQEVSERVSKLSNDVKSVVG